MKITLITAVLLAFGGGAHAGGRIQVFVNPNGAPLDVTGIAEGISSRMFAAAGVEVQWHMLRAGSRNAVPPGRAIIIDFENKAPAGLNPGTMAYALPFEGVHIVVYYDRIKSASRDNPALRATILGHVLTHEITHILQGTVQHSAAGIMKPRWDQDDYLEMARTPLPFTPNDVDLIRLGCERENRVPNGDAK
ncbi:MAG TPA: hypothetical protein VKE70_01005 [Candidatus Solibacter sp.]|nr:hypothetical protein [Candidatus Solibacter sp.]